jgi:DNA-directed RNA polymerase specialized sigma24 family protein
MAASSDPAELVRRHRALIRRVCLRVWRQAAIGSCEVEDVIGEVVLALLQGGAGPGGLPERFVGMAVRRLAWRAIRQRLCREQLRLRPVSLDQWLTDVGRDLL